MLLSSARATAVSAGLGRRAASALALKYSNAVFNAALSKSPQTLNKVQAELNTIANSIKQTPELGQFVTNPTLSAHDRLAGLSALYAAAEGSGAKKEPVSEVTKNLFVVLSENGRLSEAQGVIEGFNELVSGYKGELTVTITSAAPLPKDVQSRLETALKQSQAAQQAKSVKVASKVRLFCILYFPFRWTNFGSQINPAVLGGIVVDFGDKTLDLSVASRVTKLNSLLQRTFALQCTQTSVLMLSFIESV